MFLDSKIKKCHKEYIELINQRNEILNESEEGEGDIEEVVSKINDYIENIYAKTVFEKYDATQPGLIRIRTGEEITWKNAFGEKFEDVSKSLRHSLVGLVEGGGRYKFTKK